MKKLLSIDPGTTQSAALLWDGKTAQNPIITQNEMVKAWAVNAPPIPMAVEMVACYGMPVGSEVFETCLFIGQLKEIWLQRQLPFYLVYRLKVKSHLCHSAKAKDSNIRQALIDRFGEVGTKKNPGPLYGVSSHLWAALGVAVFAYDTLIENYE